MCACWKGVCLNLLCLKLQAKTKLVATTVDVLAIEESGKRQLDACRNTHTHTQLDEPCTDKGIFIFNGFYFQLASRWRNWENNKKTKTSTTHLASESECSPGPRGWRCSPWPTWEPQMKLYREHITNTWIYRALIH